MVAADACGLFIFVLKPESGAEGQSCNRSSCSHNDPGEIEEVMSAERGGWGCWRLHGEAAEAAGLLMVYHNTHNSKETHPRAIFRHSFVHFLANRLPAATLPHHHVCPESWGSSREPMLAMVQAGVRGARGEGRTCEGCPSAILPCAHPTSIPSLALPDY